MAFLCPTKSRPHCQPSRSTIWAVGPELFIAWADRMNDPSGTSRPATRGSYPHTATQDTLLGGASMVRHGTYCNIWCQKWVSSDSIAQFTRQLYTLHYIIFTLRMQHDIRKIIPKSSSLTSTNLRLHFCCKENSGSLGGRISVWQNVWVLHESCIQFYD